MGGAAFPIHESQTLIFQHISELIVKADAIECEQIKMSGEKNLFSCVDQLLDIV